MNKLESNDCIDEVNAREINDLVDLINDKLGKEVVSVRHSEDYELDSYINDKICQGHEDVYDTITWLEGIKVAIVDESKTFLANNKVFVVMSMDTNDSNETSTTVEDVCADRYKAMEVLVKKKKEFLIMYQEKIPNPNDNIRIVDNTPHGFLIYDENSYNKSEVWIEEKTII